MPVVVLDEVLMWSLVGLMVRDEMSVWAGVLTKLEAGLWVMSELLVALTALPSVELGIGLLWIFEVCVSLLVWPEVVGTAVSEEETAAVRSWGYRVGLGDKSAQGENILSGIWRSHTRRIWGVGPLGQPSSSSSPAGNPPLSSHIPLLLAYLFLRCQDLPLQTSAPPPRPHQASLWDIRLLLAPTLLGGCLVSACPWPLSFIRAQTGPCLSATSASWMLSPRKQNSQQGWEDPRSRAPPPPRAPHL